MVNAYEFALVQIGIAVDSTQLWWEYISFVKGEQNSICVTKRQIYNCRGLYRVAQDRVCEAEGFFPSLPGWLLRLERGGRGVAGRYHQDHDAA